MITLIIIKTSEPEGVITLKTNPSTSHDPDSDDEVLPQDLLHDYVALNDKNALLVSMTKMTIEERKKLKQSLAILQKNYKRSNKRLKLDDKPKDDFITNLKSKILQAQSFEVIEFKPITLGDISHIKDMDTDKDKEKLIIIHSQVVTNETRASAFSLHQSYLRGKYYKFIQLKFKNNEDFINYCEINLKIGKSTLYTYIMVSELIDDYPSILCSGAGVNQLYKERKKIRDAASTDLTFHSLICKPFPGMKANCEIKDPTLEIPEDWPMEMSKKLKLGSDEEIESP